MLLLFVTGTIAISDLPNYYCAQEDTFKGCMFLKDNNATCVFPFQNVNGSFDYAGDRCQRGQDRGTWELTSDFVRIPVSSDRIALDSDKFHVQRPVVMTQAKVLKDTRDNLYVEGYCQSSVAKI